MQQLDTPQDAARWLHGRVSGQLHCDSRRVRAGDGFIAWPGAATDGRRHVPSAIAQGATACLVEREGVEAFGLPGDEVASYPRLKAATGPIAAEYFGHPSAQLQVLAVTGTNGKTSTAWWLAQALSRVPGNRWPCAVIGTLGTGRPPQVTFNGLTTPDPVLLQAEFRRFVDEGLQACAIEASSIGLAERRLDGTRIGVALFTNFTQDHLDYHGSMDAYWAAKAELFRWPGLRAAVVNVDDAKGVELAGSLLDAGIDLWTVSCEHTARLQAVDVGYGSEGLRFAVVEGAQRHALDTGLVGQYNVANLLGVLAAMRALGVPLAQAVQACTGLLPVPGRMERIQQAGQPLVAVDYAHTPDALDKALQALRPLASQRGGRLWCVFGCGGDRDATKRPLMAAVAEKNADRVVVTSDNPRSEKPEAIISQILLGLSHHDCVEVQADRARAIAATVSAARPQDVILLAGKGHETYQEIAGVKHPFDDREHARIALEARP
ncbi:MAG TPA: UDP-N-acetylmuramoyl-L-alanyl-D-glutamate--2,6-diaminopimelate ligase [Ramlibacter sp.]|jgi:UDP-N-acetylmuramoyl-L-alanyl-D-glutamate--2,6-diaminopimelate ligase|uniref:UDP-N-acetylmuramoyl-L-alanyl-D-glutamate--2, 6-diaminopimelate ligase n=1 Tax=Ramlibacter sp. TaxID=1917967 RepID=UPI002D2B321C|nr:UDP-N-acetylmuramoyl-L-alanyl-D-glutamate--2,6-diaminopimelate ligase [Ramlibacter sp.]HZY17679.1 UDP-N-acetylmuramoyl-L-alanyl-D-glutamate--2,6-diaminopimelate ligase [Ramlibacter sp.]